MEITNPCYSYITNLEVIETLKALKNTKRSLSVRQLATVTYETLQYLEPLQHPDQTHESIKAFINEVRPYNLLPKEVLLMVNSPPTTPLDIQLSVEDSEERLSEDQVAELLTIVLKHFPLKVEEEEEPTVAE